LLVLARGVKRRGIASQPAPPVTERFRRGALAANSFRELRVGLREFLRDAPAQDARVAASGALVCGESAGGS
jgi:hypothetical protein